MTNANHLKYKQHNIMQVLLFTSMEENMSIVRIFIFVFFS